MEWEERIGWENCKAKFSGGNQGAGGSMRYDKSNLRDTGKGYPTELVSKIDTINNFVTVGQHVMLNPLFGPEEEEEPIGLNTEGRKRSRTGHITNESMDVEGVLQITGFAANDTSNSEVSVSKEDSVTTTKTNLARLAE